MGYRFGCAFPFDFFGENPSEHTVKLCESFSGREAVLDFCKKNLDTVELRAVNKNASPQMVLDAVKLLNSIGVSATIHGYLYEADEFFAPYEKLIDSKLQEVYNITVHPTKSESETVRKLKDICDRITEHNYPFFITLENQRIKSEDEFGICEEVCRVAEKISSPCLGLCFDFGHQLSNETKYNTDFIKPEFISLVRHTHIHSLVDEDKTHFPLSVGKAELERNIEALEKCAYDGVLSLELESARFEDRFNIKKAFEDSVSILKKTAKNFDKT